MTPKVFRLLRATCRDSTVRLSFYLSRGFCEDTPPQWQNLMPWKDAHKSLRIQILRMEDKTGGSYIYDEEYYDGSDPSVAEVIFDGSMTPINHAKFEFIDRDVQIRRTYAYWVCASVGDPTIGPAPVRVRDPEIWWPQAKVEQRMETIAWCYPGLVRIVEFGHTTLSHPLRAMILGSPDMTVAMTAGLHPRECGGPDLLVPVAEILAKEQPELLRRIGLAVLPSANYEVRERFVNGQPWLIRSNPAGVDLNRNFDADWETVEKGYGLLSDDPDSMTYRGPAPNSEAETQALVRFLEAVHPRAIFSYHGIGGNHLLASLAGGQDNAYRAACECVSEVYTGGFDTERKPYTPFGASGGSLPTWGYRRLGVPAFDVEGFETDTEKAALRDEQTPEMMAEYRRRHAAAVAAVMRTLITGTKQSHSL